MLDDQLLEDLLAEQAASATAPAPVDPLRRARRLAVLLALVPAVVLGLIGLVGGLLVAVVVLVVVFAVTAGLMLRALMHTDDARVVTAIGGRPADPATDSRLLNLVDGLCTATGLRTPHVVVVEADGLNALAAGRSPASATLVVTSRLVSELSRIELEAVLAEEIVAIRRGRMVPATVAAAVPSALVRLLPSTPPAEIDGDLAAVGVTRYPPGLIGALGKMEAFGTEVAAPASLDSLWLADPHAGPVLEAARRAAAGRRASGAAARGAASRSGANSRIASTRAMTVGTDVPNPSAMPGYLATGGWSAVAEPRPEARHGTEAGSASAGDDGPAPGAVRPSSSRVSLAERIDALAAL